MMLYEQYNVIVISVVLIKAINNQNTVVLFDLVSVYYNTATTIAAAMSPLGRKSSGKCARSSKRKRIRL